MINIAICDDNIDDIDTIQKFVTKYMNSRKILFMVNVYMSGETLLKADNKFDIVFLDIVMCGLNGIQTGKDLKSVNRNIKIIYITSFSEYWKQALNNIHAFAYLEKPIEMSDISEQINSVLCSLKEEYKEAETVSFEVFKIVNGFIADTEYMKFNVENILCFEYVGRKIIIKTKTKDYAFHGQMKDVIQKMEKYKFASCHQNFLVNLEYVQTIKGYNLFLKNGKKLPVSQKKSANFRMEMNRFIQNNL